MRVLVVEDDRKLGPVLVRGFATDSIAADLVTNGRDAIVRAGATDYAVIVLDVMLPDGDGFDVCRTLRTEHIDSPVLMLTARDGVTDRVHGLNSGADDSLVKPFDVEELKARLRALLRRSGPDGDPDDLSFAEVRLDRSRHGVWVGESFVELTRTEYQLLELLMLNPRRVLPHSLIYDRVWGYDFGPSSNALRVYVGYLRRKLEDAGAPPLIRTIRGVGYVLREPEDGE